MLSLKIHSLPIYLIEFEVQKSGPCLLKEFFFFKSSHKNRTHSSYFLAYDEWSASSREFEYWFEMISQNNLVLKSSLRCRRHERQKAYYYSPLWP